MGLLILAVLILLVLSIICVVRLKRINKELSTQNSILETQLETSDDGFMGISEVLEDIRHESRRSSDIFAAAEMLMLMSDGSQAAALKRYKNIPDDSTCYMNDGMSEGSPDFVSPTVMEDPDVQKRNGASVGAEIKTCRRRELSESEIETIIKD